MRARTARYAMLTVAVAVAVALATPGPGQGLVKDDDSSTLGAPTAQPAPAKAGPVPETTNLQPQRGVKPSTTVPMGSTRDKRLASNGNPNRTGKPTTVVDKSDRGVKDLPVSKDRGTRNLPEQRDLGDR